MDGMNGIAKTGWLPNNKICIPAPAIQPVVTGIIERGENSNSNSSIASMTAAIGVPNIVTIPAQAPAAKIIFRSEDEICMICPVSEPKAPPVAMIGPSAPKGPPVPIEIAAESGFRKVMIGCHR